MSKYPYMTFWVKDWLVDTGRLTLSERGLYITLLSLAWVSPGCRLPNDEHELRRWSGSPRTSWARIWPRVSLLWPIESDDDGRVWRFNPRQRLEWEAVQKAGDISRENGRKGGRPKQERLPLDEDQARPSRKVSIQNGVHSERTPSRPSKSLKKLDTENPAGPPYPEPEPDRKTLSSFSPLSPPNGGAVKKSNGRRRRWQDAPSPSEPTTATAHPSQAPGGWTRRVMGHVQRARANGANHDDATGAEIIPPRKLT